MSVRSHGLVRVFRVNEHRNWDVLSGWRVEADRMIMMYTAIPDGLVSSRWCSTIT